MASKDSTDNRDAKRRGMNSTLWTVLVLILLPAYFVTGFIIYFLLREPLPYKCSRCNAVVSARFNYCPECKFNLRPSCPSCRREVRLGDRYCPTVPRIFRRRLVPDFSSFPEIDFAA